MRHALYILFLGDALYIRIKKYYSQYSIGDPLKDIYTKKKERILS